MIDAIFGVLWQSDTDGWCGDRVKNPCFAIPPRNRRLAHSARVTFLLIVLNSGVSGGLPSRLVTFKIRRRPFEESLTRINSLIAVASISWWDL